MGYHVDYINGVSDHVHCLLLLRAGQNLSDMMMVLKGESSHWVNENQLTKTKFGWQDEYFAVSVSESQIEKVVRYIRTQEEHHRKKSYTEECDEFFKKYGFEKFDK